MKKLNKCSSTPNKLLRTYQSINNKIKKNPLKKCVYIYISIYIQNKYISFRGAYFSTSCFSVQPRAAGQEQSHGFWLFCSFQIPSSFRFCYLHLLLQLLLTVNNSFCSSHSALILLVTNCHGKGAGLRDFWVTTTQDGKSRRRSMSGIGLPPGRETSRGKCSEITCKV